ncbi:AraC family transcriptional regulator [bacterium SCSIO 12741]|nr:AraC family transcriptional regulator [bacterium SCSIO 12741]
MELIGTVLQIILILQGAFLLLILFRTRSNYLPVTLWLLVGSVASTLLFALGDDEHNLLVEDANWFLFHESLIITILTLYIRYFYQQKEAFLKRDFIFFVPYGIYISSQFMESLFFPKDTLFISSLTGLVAFCIMGYLVYINALILKNKSTLWVKITVISFTVIYFLDRLSEFIFHKPDTIPFLESHLLMVISAFMVYSITFQIILFPKKVLPTAKVQVYKKSTLDSVLVESQKSKLIKLYEQEKIYLDPQLTSTQLADQMSIHRQQLSELFSQHFNTKFQDFTNQYRLDEVKRMLEAKTHEHLTLLGIAREAGFGSKSAFYQTTKKWTGMTPSELKKSLG